jgi:hypothetical protein
MEDQIKTQIWEKLFGYVEDTKDFVLEQAPEIVQQVLQYEKTSAYLTSFLMLGLMAVAISFGYHFWKYPTLDKYGSREFLSFMVPIISLMVIAPLFIQFCIDIDKLMKIYIAPKYFLIELLLSVRG